MHRLLGFFRLSLLVECFGVDDAVKENLWLQERFVCFMPSNIFDPRDVETSVYLK